MPERTSYDHGVPSWVDLSTPDPEGSKAFYAALFGWHYDENDTGDGGVYVMARKDGKAAAGMMQQQPEQAEMGVPPMWNAYVTVDDADAATAAAESAGGTVIMPPMDVTDSGRMSIVADPTGAPIGLWQAREHIGCEVINEHGALAWNEEQTADVTTAAAFHEEVFGWTSSTMPMGPMGDYTVFSLGDDQIAGAMNPPAPNTPPHWSTVFSVDDVSACVETARTSGGQILAEPFDIPVGRLAVIADPQGAVFQVIEDTSDEPS